MFRFHVNTHRIIQKWVWERKTHHTLLRSILISSGARCVYLHVWFTATLRYWSEETRVALTLTQQSAIHLSYTEAKCAKRSKLATFETSAIKWNTIRHQDLQLYKKKRIYTSFVIYSFFLCISSSSSLSPLTSLSYFFSVLFARMPLKACDDKTSTYEWNHTECVRKQWNDFKDYAAQTLYTSNSLVIRYMYIFSRIFFFFLLFFSIYFAIKFHDRVSFIRFVFFNILLVAYTTFSLTFCYLIYSHIWIGNTINFFFSLSFSLFVISWKKICKIIVRRTKWNDFIILCVHWVFFTF